MRLKLICLAVMLSLMSASAPAQYISADTYTATNCSRPRLISSDFL